MYNDFMKKAIIFVNTHGFGDILHSRQGVRWVINQLGDQFDYYYLHNMHPDTCFIHPNVQVISLEKKFMSQKMEFIKRLFTPELTEKFQDALWIDVWAASFEKMKLIHGVGFKLPDKNGNYHAGCDEVQDTTTWQARLYEEKIRDINNYLIENLSTKQLQVPDHTAFVCEWNSNPKYKFFADAFINRTKNFDLHVFVCNGNVSSSQRRNFIYEKILSDYIKANQNVCFYLTAKIEEIDSPNVFYVDDNFPIPNLDQIEYLMKFCDIVVTSQSGPGCLAFTDAIVYDESKTLIIFCVDDIKTYFDAGTCEYVRVKDFSDENVLKVIKENVERKLIK